MSVLVTNQQPQADDNVSQPLLELFQKYTMAKSGERFIPFKHQAEVFKTIESDRDVFLVAGTAAGKTLAVAVPLFHKLFMGRIRKILLMYPTVALMDDQRRVMDTLAEITGLEVGQLQGGMSRTKLICELNKPVILATPDEIYWFFRKNVKYNSLLIYGLASVDEFVLDEAHLFNGLMLRNFEHLWQRIKTLSDCLGKYPKLHILTATPTDELKRLSNSHTILGRSKCDDVEVEFRPCGPFERSDQITSAINEAITTGRSKVLAVCNSARITHQLFEKYRIPESSDIPVKHQIRFGKVKLGELTQWLEQNNTDEEAIDKLNSRLLRAEDITLDDIPVGITIKLSVEEVAAHVTEILERQCWLVKRSLWEYTQRSGETWESILHNRSLPCEIISLIRDKLQKTADLEKQKSIVDIWLTDILENLNNVSEDTIKCRASEFTELIQTLTQAGFSNKLAVLIVRRLKSEMKADTEQIPTGNLSSRPVYLHWLNWLLDKEEAEKVRKLVERGIEESRLNVECRHIGLWRGTDVPVIVYSGSMSKKSRGGLIDVFSDLDRAVLISTSAVEVGVDFDADTMITEECEGNSFLQRFGRVGRRGGQSRVTTFVSGDTFAKLRELDGTSITREVFSSIIKDVFPRRSYVKDSVLLDASHYLVNEQIGRIGGRLNASPDLIAAKPLAEKIRASNIQLSYGLRSTTPQIKLRDGVTKDPFYLLRYVGYEKFRSTDSPFEVAQAKIWFTSLIFQKTSFNIIVNLEETLKASRHWIISSGDQLDIQSEYGIGFKYLNQMYGYFKQGGWNKWNPWNFLLLHGDVYLSRIDVEMPDTNPIPVQDREQNPLFIPNQTYLVIYGWKNKSETEKLLSGASVASLEELYYDWERLNRDLSQGSMVILEKATGACAAAYKELVRYVSKQV
ncbi:DEAD/DEAH box helicase [Candidatus Poribacteria bacterium]|nr:DEAD/DEAH box helicase [Candidatus Poribacteria bacterium]